MINGVKGKLRADDDYYHSQKPWHAEVWEQPKIIILSHTGRRVERRIGFKNDYVERFDNEE